MKRNGAMPRVAREALNSDRGKASTADSRSLRSARRSASLWRRSSGSVTDEVVGLRADPRGEAGGGEDSAPETRGQGRPVFLEKIIRQVFEIGVLEQQGLAQAPGLRLQALDHLQRDDRIHPIFGEGLLVIQSGVRQLEGVFHHSSRPGQDRRPQALPLEGLIGGDRFGGHRRRASDGRQLMQLRAEGRDA